MQAKRLRHQQASSHTNDYQVVANTLGWVISDDPKNLCHGYFYEPTSLTQHAHPEDPSSVPTQITANGPAEFLASGASKLSGDVTVTQPGRLIKADYAEVHSNSKKNRIEKIVLRGHVRIQRHGLLIVTNQASLNLNNNHLSLHKVLYHMSTSKQPAYNNSWGSAQTADEKNREITLNKAHYANSSPLYPAWELKANRLVLNQKTGVGRAYHSTLTFKRILILLAILLFSNRSKTS